VDGMLTSPSTTYLKLGLWKEEPAHKNQVPTEEILFRSSIPRSSIDLSAYPENLVETVRIFSYLYSSRETDLTVVILVECPTKAHRAQAFSSVSSCKFLMPQELVGNRLISKIHH
jgi:hypothetical protein